MGRILGVIVAAVGAISFLFPDGGGGSVGPESQAYTITEAEGEAAGVVADATFGTGADDAAPQPDKQSSRILIFSGDPSRCKGCVTQAENLKDVKRYKVGVDPGADIRTLRTDDGGDGTALASKYGVDLVPTTIAVDATGKQVSKLIGPQKAATLEGLLDQQRQRTAPEPARPSVPLRPGPRR